MARLVATPQVEVLSASVVLAREHLEAEVVHEVRSATRRLRVFQSLGGRRVFQADLRWLGRELSRLRDLDVFLGTPLGRHGPFADFLRSQRQRCLGPVARVLRSQRVEALLAGLRHLSPVRRRDARAAAARLEDELHEARRAVVDVTSLHELRKRARRVRFAREWLDEDPSEARRLQDATGALCDLIALRGLLDEAGRAAAAMNVERRVLAQLGAFKASR